MVGKWDVKIEYYQENRPLGTAGAFGYLIDKLTEDFFVFYGDTIMDIHMQRMLKFHKEHGVDATLSVHPNDHPYDSDIILLDKKRVKSFANKPHPGGFISHNIVNVALFIFTLRVLSEIEVGTKSYIEKDVLPKCLEDEMHLYGYAPAEYIKDMGTPERYYAVCDDLTSGKVVRLNSKHTRSAVFLDRDGTINKEVNFLNTPRQVELLPGAMAIIKINDKCFLAIVITNQPVIARGECSWGKLDEIHAKLETLLGEQHAYLNNIYVCPHHLDRGFKGERLKYKIVYNCRKPQ